MIEWRDLKDYEGIYQISSEGQIKSLDRYIHRRGCANLIKGRLLKLNKDKDGYLLVGLSRLGKTITRRVHRLVAQTFIPNEDTSLEVNHKNGIKSDNRVDNLEWVTSKQNSRHAVDTKLAPSGEEVYNSLLKEKDVINIRRLSKNGYSNKYIASLYNIKFKHVSKIIRGEIWSQVGGFIKKTKNEGDNCASSKLNSEDVVEIRNLYFKDKMLQKDIAELFKVNRATISYIVNYKSWRSVK